MQSQPSSSSSATSSVKVAVRVRPLNANEAENDATGTECIDVLPGEAQVLGTALMRHVSYPDRCIIPITRCCLFQLHAPHASFTVPFSRPWHTLSNCDDVT
jgi:hypothetical protein